MVSKRDFDKILVNLLRKYPYFLNIALIDKEGVPISFAVKSKDYQIKPATLGSKTKVLLYLSKEFANSISITDPIIQVFFFEKTALITINVKIFNQFILLDLKGWPLDAKLLYETLVEVKNLLLKSEKSDDGVLNYLFEDTKTKEAKISDISDTFLKVVAKNITTVNKIEIEPIQIKKETIPIKKNDANSYATYLKQRFTGKNLMGAVYIKDDGSELFKLEKTPDKFKQGVQTIVKNSFKELETFELGAPIWIINIFEKSEMVVFTKSGQLGTNEIYCGYLLENRLGALTDLLKIIYLTTQELNEIQPLDYLKSIIKSIEFIGFSVAIISKQVDTLLSKGQTERAEGLIERAAYLLENESKFSEAGDFYSKLGNLYSSKQNTQKAEQLFVLASNLHLKSNMFEKAGDDLFYLGNTILITGDLPKTIEYLNESLKNYKKSGSLEKMQQVNKAINDSKSNTKKQIKQYIESSTGESVPFSFLQEKFKFSEAMVIDIFKELLNNEELPGQINLLKKRYTKKRIGSEEAIVGEDAIPGKAYALPQINQAQIVQAQQALESQLSEFESTFERMNFPFEKYLEYQSKLLDFNFLEQKVKVYSSSPESKKCVVCFKSFEKKDRITECGNGHYYHLNCMKLWLENQKKCPICDVVILDNLKVMFLDTIEAKDDLISLQDIVKNLKTKINSLEEQLKQKEEQIYLMKDYTDKDKGIFEKLIVERDSKHMLEKELARNNKIIQELRGLLDLLKK